MKIQRIIHGFVICFCWLGLSNDSVVYAAGSLIRSETPTPSPVVPLRDPIIHATVQISEEQPRNIEPNEEIHINYNDTFTLQFYLEDPDGVLPTHIYHPYVDFSYSWDDFRWRQKFSVRNFLTDRGREYEIIFTPGREFDERDREFEIYAAIRRTWTSLTGETGDLVFTFPVKVNIPRIAIRAFSLEEPSQPQELDTNITHTLKGQSLGFRYLIEADEDIQLSDPELTLRVRFSHGPYSIEDDYRMVVPELEYERLADNQYQIDAHFTIPSDICYFALGRYLQVIVIDVFAKVDDEYFYKESHEILIDDLLQGDMEIPTDELVIAQGLGGSTYINVRSCDWGLVYGTNKMLLTFNGAYGSFLEKIGGGVGRTTYVTCGDVDGDGQNDVVVSLGPIHAEAGMPNIVVPRNAVTKQVIGHSFKAFVPGDQPSNYSIGEVRTAVGNFTGGPAPDQIACAQGIGGHGIVRIFQYTGEPAPNAYKQISEFYGLEGDALVQNASGGISLAAGDLDGDGLDELLVAQSYSRSSRTKFDVLDIASDGTVQRRISFQAFPDQYLKEGAGSELTVCDVDNDQFPEIIAASQGPGIEKDGEINLVSCIQPLIEDGEIAGFTYIPNGIFSIFASGDDGITYGSNPSGIMSITSGNFDGCLLNGREIMVSTGTLRSQNGYEETPVLSAYQSLLKLVRIQRVNGELIFNEPGYWGITGFSGVNNPPSGAVHISAGEILRS
ncbi:MAG: FG-GAP repeat protein [bacterium]|jgi:hypothetical protein